MAWAKLRFIMKLLLLDWRKQPNTPVFHFVKETDGWKFDLIQTLPLILQGLESKTRRQRTHPRGSSRLCDQVIWKLSFNSQRLYAIICGI